MRKVVLIDPGHGGTDPGAVSGAFIEANLNLTVAHNIKNILSEYDCNIVMTRTTDVKVDANARAKMVVDKKAALSLCVHHNAGGGDGCEVFYWHTDATAKQFAEVLLAEFVKTGQNSRGVKPSSKESHNFVMCRTPAGAKIPAVLAEYAFVDNTTDQKMIDTDAKLAAQGRAYANAAIQWLGLKKIFENPPIVTPPALKSIEEVAREVIRGVWGNGNDRKNRLKAAGYDPYAVQAVVNKIIMSNKPTTTPPIIPEAMPEPVKPPEPVVQPEPIPQTPVIVPETPPIEPQTPEVKPVPVPMPVESALVKLIKAILSLFKK